MHRPQTTRGDRDIDWAMERVKAVMERVRAVMERVRAVRLNHCLMRLSKRRRQLSIEGQLAGGDICCLHNEA